MNIKDHYNVVVIGAGIGGLVCANYLAKEGVDVLLVERDKQAGGYCTSFKRGYYNFDVCRHFGGFHPEGIMTMISSDLGIYDKLDIRRSNPSDVIIIGNKQIEVFNSTQKTCESFVNAFPDEEKGLCLLFDFLTQLNVFDVVHEYAQYTFKDLLDRFLRNEETKNAFAPLLGNAGLSASRLSAVKGLLLYNQFILDGGYFLADGNRRFSDILLEKFKERGGDAILNRAVKKIHLSAKRATGVMLGDGSSVSSDCVVAACDATETFKELIGEDNLDKDFVGKLNSLQPSMSVFMVFLGIEDLEHNLLKDKMTIWYNPTDYAPDYNFETAYKGIYEGKIDREHGHVVITSALSNRSNGPGPKAMTVTLYVGVPYKDEQFWKRNKEEFSLNVIKRAQQLIPSLSDHIRVKEIATPATFYRYTLNREGAMYGWASTPEQIADTIMPVVTPFERLFLCSHWATTGFGQGGIMSVAYTGMKLAENILKYKRLMKLQNLFKNIKKRPL